MYGLYESINHIDVFCSNKGKKLEQKKNLKCSFGSMNQCFSFSNLSSFEYCLSLKILASTECLSNSE